MCNVLEGKAHRQVLSLRGKLASVVRAHPSEEVNGKS